MSSPGKESRSAGFFIRRAEVHELLIDDVGFVDTPAPTSFHRHAGIIFLALLLVTFWFGLNPKGYPFRNQVDWTREPKGLSFAKSSIAYTGPLSSEHFLSETGDVSFTVDLGLIPAEVPPSGFSFILQLTSEDATTQFLLGQWRHELILMTGEDYSFRKRLPRITINMEKCDELVHRLIIATGPHGTVVYHNGRLAQFHPLLKCRVFETGADAWCVFGNSLHGTNSWKGTLKWIAIRRGTIDDERVRERDRKYRENGWSLLRADKTPETILAFNFSGGEENSMVDQSTKGLLTIPEHRSYVKPAFFRDSLDDVESRAGFGSDVFWNLFGFMPVGFALALMLDRRGHGLGLGRWIILILAGSTASLIIEFAQGWIPTRSSSALDWVLNSLGTALAGGLYPFCLHFLRKRASGLRNDKSSEKDTGDG